LGPADRRLVVLRHGITEHNALGIWQGHLDTPLSDQGRRQAQRAAPAVAAYRPAVIVSSDLARAAATAAAVAQVAGMPLRLDPRLREIHAGAWQGLSAAQVEQAHPGARAAVVAGEDIRRGGDGETVAEVALRVRAAAEDALGELADGELALVVTHGVAARALAADLVGIDQRTGWLGLAGLGNCCWGEIREHDGRWRLYTWNLRAPDGEGPDQGEQSAY
jgi:probable phosphoglycerate mutase